MRINVTLSRVPRFLIALFNPKQRQICRIFLFLQIFAVMECFADNPQKKEFRGVWIATINNVDWPSVPGLSVDIQKKELKELIERIEKLNLNVVIFQVRPAADAFYKSDTEPWSYFLTGRQGATPSDSFDPLSYTIELCHSKGMQLHAWFNPFRVRNIGYYKLDPTNFAAKHPQYLREYDHKLFLDPGIPQVREHIIQVIMEVVRKYDVDAIHFDDYFYPYPIAGNKYPDLKTFHQYGKGFYPNRQGDWRRDNINKFIEAVHDSIKAAKPAVTLGISPFGVWRNERNDPNGSPGIKGTTSFDDLYADVYHWLAKSWIDYVIPQVYWEQGNRFGDFATMVKWWNDHSFGKQLYIGQALYKSTGASKVFENPKEITQQISILRKFENVSGFALYSASHLSLLSETALADLTSSLQPPNVDQQENEAIASNLSTGIDGLPDKIRERIILADKKSLADSINIRYKALIDNELPIPEKFSVVKSREGWKIYWKIKPTAQTDQLKFTVTMLKRIKGGGYQERILVTTEELNFLVIRKSDINPGRVLFSIASTNRNGFQSSFSKLFRVRGRRIIYTK